LDTLGCVGKTGSLCILFFSVRRIRPASQMLDHFSRFPWPWRRSAPFLRIVCSWLDGSILPLLPEFGRGICMAGFCCTALHPLLHGFNDRIKLVSLHVPIGHIKPNHALTHGDSGDLPTRVYGPTGGPATHVEAFVVMAYMAKGAPADSPTVRPTGHCCGRSAGAVAGDRAEPQPVTPQ